MYKGKYIALILNLFLSESKGIAQQSVVQNTGLNVLYEGIVNKLTIASYKIKKENLIVECEKFEIRDSIGYYFLFLPHNAGFRDLYIKLRDKQKDYCEDSVLFRVKKIPRPEPRLGGCNAGNHNKMAVMSQTSLLMIIENFTYEGIKATVKSFRFTINNPHNLIYVQKNVVGNSASKMQSTLNATIGYTELILDSIQYELLGKIEYSREPFIIYLENYSKDYILEGINKYGKKELINYEKNGFESINKYEHKYCKEVIDSDTCLISEKIDSTLNTYRLIHYYKQKKKNIKEVEFIKLDDTLYSIKMFDSVGNLIAKGMSRKPIYYLRIPSYSNIVTFPDFQDSFNFYYALLFCYQQYLEPIGKWEFHNINNGNKIYANFLHLEEPIIEERPFMIICAPSAFEYIKPTGTWQLLDKNNQVIEEKTY